MGLVCQVKYEPAGRRASKVLGPIGFLLPRPSDITTLLPVSDATPSPRALRGASPNNDPDQLQALPGGSDTMTVSGRAGSRKTGVRDESDSQEAAGTGVEEPTRMPFGWQAERRSPQAEDDRVECYPDVGGVESVTLDANLAAALVSKASLVVSELDVCAGEVDGGLEWQERNVRAAEAILYCTQPVAKLVRERWTKETSLLEELGEVANKIEQPTVVADLRRALAEAEARVERLEALSATLEELHGASTKHVDSASHRYVSCLPTPTVILHNAASW